MKVSLDGRVALVTGAATGIGRATADLLRENGAEVVYSDRNADGVREAAGDSSHIALDIADRASIDRGVAEAMRRHGRIDILVNNAGIGVSAGRPQDRSTSSRRGLGRDARDRPHRRLPDEPQAVGREDEGRRRRRASSTSPRCVGLVPMRLQSSYVAAKAGVVNLTRSMALELAPHGILRQRHRARLDRDRGLGEWINDHGERGAGPACAADVAHPARPAGRRRRRSRNGALFLVAPESSLHHRPYASTIDGGWTAGFSRDF